MSGAVLAVMLAVKRLALVVRTEGKRQVKRSLRHYSLDAIISVGYRVNSTRATRFRQWATTVLREHLTQGYTLNRQRFEQNAAELEGLRQASAKEIFIKAAELANDRP